MYCGNCGRQTSDTNRYCEHCRFDLIHIQKLLNESDEDEGEAEDEFRSAAAVARRCLVLAAVVAASHKEDRIRLTSWLKSEGLWEDVSPLEKSLFQSGRPKKTQLINSSWRVEALYLLLWALRLIPTLEVGKTPAEPPRLRDLLPFLGQTSDFIMNSELRPQDEISDLSEKIYQAHWSIRNARFNGKSVPDDVDPGVIMERHYGINWLMGSGVQPWDDVTTDT